MIRSAASEANYRKEWKEIIDCLYSYPSIAVWVPFNEAWGQFKTPEIVAWTKEYDPSRLVNPASGGNHYTCGDILDLHHYPGPNMFLYDPRRATVLGEYGGIGLEMCIRDRFNIFRIDVIERTFHSIHQYQRRRSVGSGNTTNPDISSIFSRFSCTLYSHNTRQTTCQCSC